MYVYKTPLSGLSSIYNEEGLQVTSCYKMGDDLLL